MKNEVSENFISDYDKEIKEIADYTVNFSNFSDLSRQTAYHVLLDLSLIHISEPTRPY